MPHCGGRATGGAEEMEEVQDQLQRLKDDVRALKARPGPSQNWRLGIHPQKISHRCLLLEGRTAGPRRGCLFLGLLILGSGCMPLGATDDDKRCKCLPAIDPKDVCIKRR